MTASTVCGGPRQDRAPQVLRQSAYLTGNYLDMGFDFAIIGAGLTATAMLRQLVNRAREKIICGSLDPSKIQVQVFEKQDVFGPGFPHCDTNVMPFHITNMCAGDMGIVFGSPGDFQHWVAMNRSRLIERFQCLQDSVAGPDSTPNQCNHYPRAVMGEYLKTRFQQAVRKARRLGLKVNLYPRSEVVDLREEGDKAYLVVKSLVSGKSYSRIADCVLLATGHWREEAEPGNYFPSPWPAKELLRRIPEGANVAVIGTSLSAIEVVLTLTSDGKFIRTDSDRLVYEPSHNPRKIVLYSRRGLLPKVRGKTGGHRNRILTRENVERLVIESRRRLTLEAIFQLLNAELEVAYGRPIDWEDILSPKDSPRDLLRRYLKDSRDGDGPGGEIIWQTVLHQAFPMVRELYLMLNIQDRKRFDLDYSTIFFTHAATQPSINAEKLLALMNSGVVEVHRLGENYRFVKNDANESFEFIYWDNQGKTRRDVYRYVVNARGQERSIQTDPSSLARNLLGNGIVQIEEFQHVDHARDRDSKVARDPQPEFCTYKTGSIWIDPKTHQIMRMGLDGKTTRSNTIRAVGAMTRGQIIDASMAYGIVRSTAKIAEDLVRDLSKMNNSECAESGWGSNDRKTEL